MTNHHVERVAGGQARMRLRALLLRVGLARLSRRGVRWIVGASAAVAVAGLACGGIAWRLASGPISLDLATPWLTSALQERLGEGRRLAVGGTQLERDDDGRTALRLRDIVVRDTDGNVVASAPKAEVGIASGSL